MAATMLIYPIALLSNVDTFIRCDECSMYILFMPSIPSLLWSKYVHICYICLMFIALASMLYLYAVLLTFRYHSFLIYHIFCTKADLS